VAEANDIVNLLLDGVSGLVLTGESATGSDPLDAIERVAQLLDGMRDFALQVTGNATEMPDVTSPETASAW
jgi:pyruvate kinase